MTEILASLFAVEDISHQCRLATACFTTDPIQSTSSSEPFYEIAPTTIFLLRVFQEYEMLLLELRRHEERNRSLLEVVSLRQNEEEETYFSRT